MKNEFLKNREDTIERNKKYLDKILRYCNSSFEEFKSELNNEAMLEYLLDDADIHCGSTVFVMNWRATSQGHDYWEAIKIRASLLDNLLKEDNLNLIFIHKALTKELGERI